MIEVPCAWCLVSFRAAQTARNPLRKHAGDPSRSAALGMTQTPSRRRLEAGVTNQTRHAGGSSDLLIAIAAIAPSAAAVSANSEPGTRSPIAYTPSTFVSL